MKFCKTLDHEIESLPHYLRVFINYKQLKKTIKTSAATSSKENVTQQEKVLEMKKVLEILKADIERLNNFFIGQEEDAVIRIEALADQLRQLQGIPGDSQPPASKQKLLEIKQQLVHFHGQMVMLDHWSSLNYNGLSKILKKHDKQTRGSLKAEYMGLLKKQPFIQTERVNEFAHRADELAQAVESRLAALAPSRTSNPGLQEPEMARLVVRALNTWTSLANSASTPSTIMVVPAPLHQEPPNQDVLPCSVMGSSSTLGPRGKRLSPAAAITKQRPGSGRSSHAGRTPRSSRT